MLWCALETLQQDRDKKIFFEFSMAPIPNKLFQNEANINKI